MRSYADAKLTTDSRLALVKRVLDDHERLIDVANAFGVSRHTARKWVQRFQVAGEAGLSDRSKHRTGRLERLDVAASAPPDSASAHRGPDDYRDSRPVGV